MLLTRTCTCVAVALAAMTVEVRSSWAQDGPAAGDASLALPGIKRVPLIGGTAPRFGVAIDTGYSLTESQKSEGMHHRILGSMGLGLVPLRGLELGVLGSVRHDRHPDDGLGTDSGTIGQVSLLTRYSTRLGRALGVGADVGVNFPGSEKPMDSLASPAIDTRALLGWVPIANTRTVGYVGFRYDRGAHVGADALRYRTGDRLALGLSDFNAVLVGWGISVPLGKTEILGEVTGDLLVGSGAPPVSQSPFRVNFGARRAFSKHLLVELLSEFVLSSRPSITSTSPLIPIEPRIGISIGFRYRIWNHTDQQNGPPTPVSRSTFESTPIPVAPPPPSMPDAKPATGRLVVTVVNQEGHPLSDANAQLVTEAGSITLDFQNGSTFATDRAIVGHGRLVVHADLMRDAEQEVEIVPGQALELQVTMITAELSGKVRGQIRAYDGSGLAAHVRVTPGEREVRANSDGAFSVDVPPGKYRVDIWLDGYLPQQRTVKVDKSGVMVLNVDLQKAR